MNLLDDATDRNTGVAGLVNRLASRFRPISRRSLLVGTAVAASALATNPRAYALTPGTAYGAVCGPGNTPGSGWSVFCCTINNGVNACPPGSFTAGWWKASDSSWCGNGYRYLIDCNARCTRCSTGCSDHICDKGCWNCSCGHGSSKTCDQRLVCCNAFRYGQCNTHVTCSGGVHCRMVSCVPPYQWDNCSTTAFSDSRTGEHSAPCIPAWSAIEVKYDRLGGPGSFLRQSTGPIRAVGDGKGKYVLYQGGAIYWSSATHALAMPTSVKTPYAGAGGPRGVLGYPLTDRTTGLRNGGWIQLFQNGAITDSPDTTTQVVWGARYDVWKANGREGGILGYPVGPRNDIRDSGWIQGFQNGVITDSAHTVTQVVWGIRYDVWRANGRENGVLGYPTGPRANSVADGWIQTFQKGAITDSPATTTQTVWGIRYDVWKANGRERGVLGYPTSARSNATGGGWVQTFQKGAIADSPNSTTQTVWGIRYDVWKANGREAGILGYPTGPRTTTTGGWIQTFQKGAITDSTSTTTQVVAGVFWPAWVAADRQGGVLGYPKSGRLVVARGSYQQFVKGELWALGSGPARRVYGAVLTQWKAAGGATGAYGFPTTDTKASGARLTCTFEHGTITA